MRILLTGANGFIGRYLLAHLLAAGHEIVPAVRRPAETDRLLPCPASIHAELNTDVTAEIWLPRLAGIDAVINCAGVLQGAPGQSIAAIHSQAPRALFEACQRSGVRRVVQVSAISAGADTEYAKTKRAADEYLMGTALDWVILRPSLVYASGAYGGTALFRALASFPFFIPVVGSGKQPFQPIHVADFCEAIIRILAKQHINRTILEPVGPDRLTLRQMLVDLRSWLGFAPAPVVSLPLRLGRIAATIGDVFGGIINSTSLRQLEYGNAGAPEPFVATTGIQPRHWRDALLAEPAQVQDRWHARFYLLRPLLRVSVALTWLWSGCAGLIARHTLIGRFAAFGIALSPPLIWGTCLLDVAIGCAVLARWRTGLTVLAQILLVVAYTAALTFAQPALWADPLGPLLKNIPFLLAVLVLAVLERER